MVLNLAKQNCKRRRNNKKPHQRQRSNRPPYLTTSRSTISTRRTKNVRPIKGDLPLPSPTTSLSRRQRPLLAPKKFGRTATDMEVHRGLPQYAPQKTLALILLGPQFMLGAVDLPRPLTVDEPVPVRRIEVALSASPYGS